LINEPYLCEIKNKEEKEEIKQNLNNFDFSVSLSNLGEYYIYRVKNNIKTQVNKPKIMNILVIDNSGSMGTGTKEATLSIGQGMFDLPKEKIDMVPGIVILFSENADILSKNICSPNDVSKLQFPRQGQTNITAGIETAIDCILQNKEENKTKQIHYILTFLSDGGHNWGPILDSPKITKMREEILLMRKEHESMKASYFYKADSLEKEL
jgi:uncharacterized protein with von Willebrand factor type A (vWA) domain